MGDEDRTESYSINVKYITGAVIHIQCSPEETVEFVKLRLQLINGVSTECQHLIWNSVDLDNDFTLKDYGIPDQAEISLAVAMRAAPVLSKSDHEYFIDMAEAIREIEQQNAQCEQQNNGHDQGCEGGSRDDAAFLFLDAHCDADSSTFSEGTAPVNQDLQNVLEEIEAKRVEESVLRGKVEQLQEKMKKEKKKRVKRKVYEEEEEKSILKEAVTDLELSEMKKKLNTVRCLWNNNNEAGGQFETAENTQGENSSYDGRTAQARLDKFESFPSTLKNDVGVSFSRTEGLMDRFSDGLKNMWKYENDPDFGEKVRKEILESGAIPKLPPINIKRRCSLCKRKTGVCSTFKCRCGFEFCTEHRYPEAHSCTYDFKAEGKNIIRKNNPLVQAPKLPKI